MHNISYKQIYGNGKIELRLATGSPGELGLLQALANEFTKLNDTKICWIKAGSGESLKLLKDKAIDIAMTHIPMAEIKAVRDGWGGQRMVNLLYCTFFRRIKHQTKIYIL